MEKLLVSLVATMLFIAAVLCVLAGVLTGGVWLADNAVIVLFTFFFTVIFAGLWHSVYHFIYYRSEP